jgi:hypothetical protein
MMPVMRRATFSDRAEQRKQVNLLRALLYFHDALAEIGQLILAGEKQHKTQGWDRSKSGDELEALLRHVIDAGYVDTDDQLHSTKIAWRALANLQKELETQRGLPISVGSHPGTPVNDS